MLGKLNSLTPHSGSVRELIPASVTEMIMERKTKKKKDIWSCLGRWYSLPFLQQSDTWFTSDPSACPKQQLAPAVAPMGKQGSSASLCSVTESKPVQDWISLVHRGNSRLFTFMSVFLIGFLIGRGMSWVRTSRLKSLHNQVTPVESCYICERMRRKQWREEKGKKKGREGRERQREREGRKF